MRVLETMGLRCTGNCHVVYKGDGRLWKQVRHDAQERTKKGRVRLRQYGPVTACSGRDGKLRTLEFNCPGSVK
jgi:hypothetical protein